MTDTIQSDDPILQGFDTYLKSRRYLHAQRQRACAVMRYKVLPQYSLKELRELDEFDLADSINRTGNRNTAHGYRHVIRKFKEYLMKVEA